MFSLNQTPKNYCPVLPAHSTESHGAEPGPMEATHTWQVLSTGPGVPGLPHRTGTQPQSLYLHATPTKLGPPEPGLAGCLRQLGARVPAHPARNKARLSPLRLPPAFGFLPALNVRIHDTLHTLAVQVNNADFFQ